MTTYTITMTFQLGWVDYVLVAVIGFVLGYVTHWVITKRKKWYKR